MVQTDNSEHRVSFSIETDNLWSSSMPAEPPEHRSTLTFLGRKLSMWDRWLVNETHRNGRHILYLRKKQE